MWLKIERLQHSRLVGKLEDLAIRGTQRSPDPCHLVARVRRQHLLLFTIETRLRTEVSAYCMLP